MASQPSLNCGTRTGQAKTAEASLTITAVAPPRSPPRLPGRALSHSGEKEWGVSRMIDLAAQAVVTAALDANGQLDILVENATRAR